MQHGKTYLCYKAAHAKVNRVAYAALGYPFPKDEKQFQFLFAAEWLTRVSWSLRKVSLPRAESSQSTQEKWRETLLGLKSLKVA